MVNECEIRNRLEADIKCFLGSGGKIDVRKVGESTPIDATNEWPKGFSNDDNVFFHRKVPRHV